MMSQTTSTSTDFTAPLPSRQFRGFLVFFHLVFVSAIILLTIAHVHRAGGFTSSNEVRLAVLVALQISLYLFLFAIPSLTENAPGWNWLRSILRIVSTPQNLNWPAFHWYMFYIVVSVGLVLAECRIDREFEWALICYVGQISALPAGVSVPGTVVIFAAWILNRFGWTELSTWGFARWFDLMMQVVPGGVVILFLGKLVVTSGERGRLIAELQAAKRALELARQRDAELAALRERERLARDLHDNLGHSLVTMTVQLEAAQRLLSVDPSRAAVLLEEMKALSRSSMESLRRSLANLRAPGLGDKPLTQALQSLCADVSHRTGLKIDCQIAEGADGLPPAVVETLWHVAQEGLTNVEKHAQAQQAGVSLALQPELVVLRVTDDGIGLPPDAERKPGHYGLRGMRERIEGVGGTFVLTRAEPRGTIVEARVPLIG